MLTRSEKTYLALTLFFLAAGLGLKAWRRATVRIGPFPDPATLAQDSLRAVDSAARAADPRASADTGAAAGSDLRSAGMDSTAALSPLPGGEASARGPAGGKPASEAEGEGSTGDVPAGGGSRFARETGSARSGRKASLDGPGSPVKIDLNRADAAGLMRIKGVGEKTAQSILAYRRAHGPFREVRDLLQIKGIGEKKLEKLAPHIIL